MKLKVWLLIILLLVVVTLLPRECSCEEFTVHKRLHNPEPPPPHSRVLNPQLHYPTLRPPKPPNTTYTHHPRPSPYPGPTPHNQREILKPKDTFTPLITDKHLSGLGVDPSFKGVPKDWEQGEAEMAHKYMGSCKNILEVGGGSGKVSHYLNRNLRNPKAHLVVEPSVWDIGNHIADNRDSHKDQYLLDKRKITDIPLSEITEKIGPVDCIVSDCEGCMLDFYKKNPHVFATASKIMNEMDGHNPELRKMWSDHGYTYLVKGCGCGGCGCDTDLWVRGPNPRGHSQPRCSSSYNPIIPPPAPSIPRKKQEVLTPRSHPYSTGGRPSLPTIQPPHPTRQRRPRKHPSLPRHTPGPTPN